MRGTGGNKLPGGALAAACEVAELDHREQMAVMLAAAGASLREIALELGLPGRRSRAGKKRIGPAREILVTACEKLALTHRGLLGREIRWLKAVIWCQRNKKPGGAAPVAIYAKVPGGHDETPVNVRARPHGERAEDHLDDPYDFLRAFEVLANGL